MNKKKGANNIPNEELIKAMLDGVDSDAESVPAFEVPEEIEFPKIDESFEKKLNISAEAAKEDRTVAIDQTEASQSLPPSTVEPDPMDVERTIAVTAFAKRKKNVTTVSEEKVAVGMVRPTIKAGLVHTSIDASLAQAENLKVAQQRIIDLEKEIDHLRSENDELAAAGHIVKQKVESLNSQAISFEKEKKEIQENLENEILILKGNLQYKESENLRLKQKTDELENRLKNDFKKIRVRERELENRLELARAEKQALVRSKDDTILELQRKIDQMRNEIDTYREKIQELNNSVEAIKIK